MSVIVDRRSILPLDVDAIARSAGKKGVFKKLYVRGLQKVADKPLQPRSTPFIEGLRTLLGALSSSNAPELSEKVLGALYSYLISPSSAKKRTLKALLQDGVAKQAAAADFDIDGVIALTQTLSQEIGQWHRQIMNLTHLHNLQLHDQLKAHGFHSDEFNTLIKAHLTRARAHLQVVLMHTTSQVVPARSNNSNAQNFLQTITSTFMQDVEQELIHFVYRRKFGTDSTKIARYFATKSLPKVILMQASAAVDKKKAHIMGAPELHFEGTEAIKAKKEELKAKKSELAELINAHDTTEVRINALLANMRSAQTGQELTTLEPAEKKAILKLKTGSRPSDEELADLHVFQSDKDAYDAHTELEAEQKQIKREIPTLKLQCEELEYEVQMLRLDFVKAHRDLINRAINHYYNTQVAPIAAQNATNFHYHYDLSKLVGYDMAALATKLGITETSRVRAKYVQSGYGIEVKADDQKVKKAMSVSSLPTTKADQKKYTQQLKKLEKRKFYLPGSNTHVIGISGAIDLYLAASSLVDHPEHGPLFTTIKEKVLQHIIKLKTDIYVLNAKLAKEGDGHEMKQSIFSQFGDDITGINLGNQEKAPSPLIEGLYTGSDTHAIAAHTQDIIGAYTAAKHKALAQVKASLREQTEQLKLHTGSNFVITHHTTLNDLFAHYPDRIAQFDQVLVDFRKHHGLEAMDQAVSAPMAPSAMKVGSSLHNMKSSYYASLPIARLAKLFNPLLSDAEAFKATAMMVEKFRHISYAPVADEVAIDYDTAHMPHLHSTLPPSLQDLDLPLSSKDEARLNVAKAVSARISDKSVLKDFPHLEARFQSSPKVFYQFYSQFAALQVKLSALVRMVQQGRSDRTINSHKIRLFEKARRVSKAFLDTMIDTNRVELPYIHQETEELMYVLESVFAKTLYKAMHQANAPIYELKAIAQELQKEVKKGLIDHVLSFSLGPNTAGRNRPGFLKNLVPHPLQLTGVSDELKNGFVIGQFQQEQFDARMIGYKLHLSKLFSQHPDRQISFKLISEVIHEPSVGDAADEGYLGKIQGSFTLFKNLLSLKERGLGGNIANFNDQYQKLCRDAAALKERHPQRAEAIDRELLEIKISIFKQELEIYERALGITTSSWKAYYAHSIAIIDQLKAYEKLGSEDITLQARRLQSKLMAKRVQLKAQFQDTFEQEWSHVLNCMGALIHQLITTDADGAPMINQGVLTTLEELVREPINAETED